MFEAGRCVYVYNQTKETFLALKVKVADTFLGRMVGLLGRRTLEAVCGVWIVPCNSIHTFGMLFTIDVVFIDENFKVVGLQELVKPFSITRPNFRAESAIELPAHTIFRSGTAIGDQFVIERYESARVAWAGSLPASSFARSSREEVVQAGRESTKE